MMTFSLSVAIFLAPLVVLSSNSSPSGSEQQHARLEYPQQAMQSFPFNDLPPDLKAHVLQFVPLDRSLVCHEWMQLTKERRALELQVFLESAKHFESLFRSENDFYDEWYLGRHLRTEGRRDRMYSRAVASLCDTFVELVNTTEEHSAQSQALKTLMHENGLIKKLPKMSSSDPKRRLFDLLSGVGNFTELPLCIRQFLAKQLWASRVVFAPVCSLSTFLSFFHDKFDMFKDIFINFSSHYMAAGCVEIALGIECVKLCKKDQERLFDSIRSLFPEDTLMDAACSLYEKVSPDSAVLDIVNVMKEHPLLSKYMEYALGKSLEHMSAFWCVEPKAEGSDRSQRITCDYQLLFNDEFLRKHQLSPDVQLRILKPSKIKRLFEGLSPDLTNVNLQALVQRLNDNPDIQNALPFNSLVTLYSLDNDVKAFTKYSQLLLEAKKQNKGLLEFSHIALGTHSGQHLTLEKKIVLLKQLYPEMLPSGGHLDAVLSGDDRKALVAKVASFFVNVDEDYDEFVRELSESDLSLWMEACLDGPEKYKLPLLDHLNSESVVQVLIKYIGDDIQKLTQIQHLPEYYQIMTFLLTDFDKVAEHLSKSEALKRGTHWEDYFPRSHSSWRKATKAATRLHNFLTQTTQPNHS